MRDHLHDPARHSHRVEDEEAERHEAHVRDRRIGNELFHVRLDKCHEPDIDDRDQRQGDDEACQLVRCVGSNRQRKAQEAIRAELQHDGRQDDRAAGRSFDVRIGKPRMHRPHRHLDRECCEERQKEKRLRRHAKADLMPVENAETPIGRVVQIHECDEHQQRARKRVQKKLDRCVDAVGAAPYADDHVHRHQRRLEENEEQQSVRSRENTDHQSRQDQKGRVVLRDARFDHLPSGEHDDHRHERRQQHEPDRDAVDTEVIVRIQPLDPRHVLDELQLRKRRIESGVERNGDDEPKQAADQRQRANHVEIAIAAGSEDRHAKADRNPDREAEPGRRGLHGYRTTFNVTNSVTSTRMPMIIPNA